MGVDFFIGIIFRHIEHIEPSERIEQIDPPEQYFTFLNATFSIFAPYGK